MKKLQHITEICEELYWKFGASAVYDHVNEQQEKNNLAYKDVNWIKCEPCDAETPQWKDICLVCGSTNHPVMGDFDENGDVNF